MKDTVCALLSWGKADLEHKKENVEKMLCERKAEKEGKAKVKEFDRKDI